MKALFESRRIEPSARGGADGRLGRCRILVAATVLCLAMVAHAFPPAPHQLLFGTVRNEYGTPIITDQVQILLQTPNGSQLLTTVVPGLGFDMNYAMEVPMDAGLSTNLYEPEAMIAGMTYTMYVVVGTTTNLPIEMAGAMYTIGQPGQEARVDLTLGVDSNGDGIPDAWELAFLAAIGSNLNLTNLNPNLRLTPDGLTLWQQYLAGTYPFDPQQPFVVSMVALDNGAPLLQFTGMTGRYYTLLGSPDLQAWTPLSFFVPAEGTNAPAHAYYYAPQIQTIQVQAIQPTTGPTMQFFKMMLQ